MLKVILDKTLSPDQLFANYLEEREKSIITLGMAFPSSYNLISESLILIKEEYGEVRFDIRTGNCRNIREMLQNGMLDIAITPEYESISGYIPVRIINSFNWGIAAPRGVRLSTRKYLIREDVLRYPVVMPSEKICADVITDWLSKDTSSVSCDKYSAPVTMSEMIRSGLGIGFCPLVERRLVESYGLELYALSPVISTPLYIYSRKRSVLPDAAGMLVDMLRE